MLVTDRHRTRGRELVPLVAEAAGGGVGIVQLRERDLPDVELRELVHRLLAALPAGVPMVVNGNWRVARTCGVGLHLPAAAPPLPPGRAEALPLIGRSAHDLAEARVAVEEGASYVVLGTIYPTPSKPDLPGQGPAIVGEVTRGIAPLPVFAIGGVRASKVPALVRAGAHGVAVCGAILSANEPRRVAEALALALEVASAGARSG